MADLHAYAVGVAELRAMVGAGPAEAERFRGLVSGRQAQPEPDRLGPLYRRVPGTIVRADEPTPADLDALLAGRPVRAGRAAATWHLVAMVAAGLAWSSTVVPDGALPPGLLAKTGLPVPPVDGLTVRWCSVGAARQVPALVPWLTDADGWASAAGRAHRPAPDVVVVAR